MKNKIHFACLFGVDYELDLMPYWIDHWLSHHLDYYKVFLHREAGNIDPAIVREFKYAGFDVTEVDGPHSNGLLRAAAISNYASNMESSDFLVAADADEFHMIDYRKVLDEYDVVTGFMVDRYGDRLEKCTDNPFVQYYHEEPFTQDILKNFTPPFLQNTQWPCTMRTKVLACRAGEESTYAGSHVMKLVSSNSRILDNQKVYHFAWRESAARKTAVKSYFSEENLFEIFAGKVPEENVRHFNELKRMDQMELV